MSNTWKERERAKLQAFGLGQNELGWTEICSDLTWSENHFGPKIEV